MAKVLFESGFKIVTPAAWKIKNLDTLKQKPVVAYGNHHAYLDEYFRAREWDLGEQKVSRLVEDWFSVVELVRHGFGWSIIPESWQVHTDAVKEHPVSETIAVRQKVYLFFRREDRKSEWVKTLEDWLKSRHT